MIQVKLNRFLTTSFDQIIPKNSFVPLTESTKFLEIMKALIIGQHEFDEEEIQNSDRSKQNYHQPLYPSM